MANKFLVTKDSGPATIEADEAQLIGNGMLVFFNNGSEPNTGSPVAAFIHGSWRSFERLDTVATVH